MKSDAHFQEIFKARPDWLYELLGIVPPPNCTFTSPVLKTVERRLDGFLVGEGQPPRVIEIQMRRLADVYYRAGMELAQVALERKFQPNSSGFRAATLMGVVPHSDLQSCKCRQTIV